MKVTRKPDTQKYVDKLIEAGQFATADEILNEAVSRMMGETDVDLDDETVAAINRAEDQIDRGEGIDFDQFAAEWRARLNLPAR